MDDRELKIAAARAALDEVRAGMRLGLGTGSTAEEFVLLLAAHEHAGTVRCTSTSVKTEKLARAHGLEVLALDDLAPLDLAVDGADEIDPALRLIKGRGGALLREKIVEQQARRFIVIADASKLVDRLGAGPLPVEVTPFALEQVRRRFDQASLFPVLRMDGDAPFKTDEGNRILDVRVPLDLDLADVVDTIRSHAGVIDTGFFPDEATEAFVASPSGVRHIRR